MKSIKQKELLKKRPRKRRKESAAEKLATEAHTNMMLLCKAMRYDPDDYSEMVFNSGLDYLIRFLPLDRVSRKKLRLSSHFWAWFKSQWNNYNSAFVKFNDLDKLLYDLDEYDVQRMRGMYADLHRLDPRDIYPSEVIMHQVFGEKI